MNDENQSNESPLNSNADKVQPSKDFQASAVREYQMAPWLKIAILAGVVVLASIGYFTSQLRAPPASAPVSAELPGPEELAAREPITDFILTEENGTQKKLSDFRGNVVILSFWASWCGPCLVELPTFAEMERKFHDRGLRVVPINVDEGEEGRVFAKDFWPNKKLPFSNYYDTNKTIAQQFEVSMLPSNFIIDRQGRMVFESAGASDWSAPETLDLIESVLREPAQAESPPVESTPAIAN